MSDSAAFDPLDSFFRSWSAMTMAPQKLWQSFNNGWTFGNVTINDVNSSAPQTEQAILAQESYGRQIGKLLDAVDMLAKRQPDWNESQAFRDIDTLRKKIEGVKRDMAIKRIDQLRSDLAVLRESTDEADQGEYTTRIAALRAFLDDGPPALPG